MKVLIIGYVWPQSQISAAGMRTWNLIETFQSQNWEVHFACCAQDDVARNFLKSQGILTQKIQVNHPSFNEWIQHLKRELVIYDRFIVEEQFGWRVRLYSPQSIEILDTQDLHFLRKARFQQLYRLPVILPKFDFFPELLRELGSIFRVDHTWVLSQFEYQVLTEVFQVPSFLISVHRFHYAEPIPSSISFHQRKDFVMIGNFRHHPNTDAMRWLRDEIWPEIRKALPGARVWIYGAYPLKKIKILENTKLGFYVSGFIESLFPTLEKFRINLAPLRFGAGIKGKITDGWWVGTPVVSTSIGSEGMAGGLPWGGAIADDPLTFAQKCIQLYTFFTDWEKAQQNGYKILRLLYAKKMGQEKILDSILNVKEHLVEWKQKNVFRQLLKFHHFQGTKYFSKWLEEKAKNAHKIG